MRPRASALLALSVLLVALVASTARDESGTVVRVVDGDTLVVRIGGRAEKVRLIGVDTPESVDPRRPVQCFGKEASEFTRRLAEGKRVTLLREAGPGDRDRYGRLLRYVFSPDGTLLNGEIIRQGYGHAYLRYPFARMEEFRALERQAREHGLGLWALSAPPGRPEPAAAVGIMAGRPTAQAVYVGSARDAGYTPCGVCRPPAAKPAGTKAR
jgi:micrococcal nuclease